MIFSKSFGIQHSQHASLQNTNIATFHVHIRPRIEFEPGHMSVCCGSNLRLPPCHTYHHHNSLPYQELPPISFFLNVPRNQVWASRSTLPSALRCSLNFRELCRYDGATLFLWRYSRALQVQHCSCWNTTELPALLPCYIHYNRIQDPYLPYGFILYITSLYAISSSYWPSDESSYSLRLWKLCFFLLLIVYLKLSSLCSKDGRVM